MVTPFTKMYYGNVFLCYAGPEAGGWAAGGPEGNLHHVHLNTEAPGILWGLGAGHWRRVLSSDDGSGPKLYNEFIHTGVTS